MVNNSPNARVLCEMFFMDRGPSHFTEATLAAGSTLCGWGKGKFKQSRRESLLSDQEILFEPSPETMVAVDNQVMCIGSILNDMKRRKGIDHCKVCYHSVSQGLDGTWMMRKDRHVVQPYKPT